MRLNILAAMMLSGATFLASPALAQKTDLTLGAATADVSKLDPHFASSTADRMVVAWIYGALVRFAPGSTDPSTIEPDLAESWEASADQLVWTFKLREGVQFQQGYGEVTADDVVFSLKKAMNPETSAFSTDYEAFKDIEAVDPYTVRITLAHNIPNVLGPLSNYSGGFIISKKAYEERGETYARDPIGFGPFTFASSEPGVAMQLAAHKDYFRGAPKLEKITLRMLNNAASRDLAFTAGEVDAVAGTADMRWLERTRATGAMVDIFEPAELTNLHVNTKMAPFDDLKVRQALAYAMRPGDIVTMRGADFSREAKSVIPSNNLGYTADAGDVEFDADMAKKLLAEAGYPDGIDIKMISSQLPSFEAAAQVLQAQLAESGIRLQIESVEHSTWHEMIRKDLSPLVYYGAARFPVADVYLTQFFYSPSAMGAPAQVTNFSHCDVADAEIEAARVELDPAKQLELWATAQRKIIENVCAVPGTEGLNVWARKPTLDWGYSMEGSMSLGPQITELTHFTE